ncbi:cation:proton antiporter [Roseivivax sediminis]|uniref:Kef-type K+ transport system, membrane component KefB n=1 Tax=Roseivivax sediminis TaxID=936889 RepID=A0A1I1VPE3_9RHOB|nr:cation:proton antiporter [Roseivivax sediminis]SFD84679.1 Kef-type K+ transport system, membrane component KefB [Roseivivax sediminis]
MTHDHLLITLGGLFLAGLLADQAGRLTRLPRVTMLLLIGITVGQSGFGLVPDAAIAWFDLISVVALTMVAFLLGGELTRETLRRHGRAILTISISVVVGTLIIVAAGLTLAGLDLRLALILGAIATATAPAAIADVIRQSGIRNGFTETLSGIVAIDDVWGLIVFSVALALASQGEGWAGLAAGTAHDLGGAALLGTAIGMPAAVLTGRLSPGEPLQAEALGIVCLTAGLALWLEVSFLLAGITAGAIVANLARHHDHAFHEIEHIEWPFMLLFFLLAGASLEIGMLRDIGWIGALYVGLRTIARIFSAAIGARIGSVPASQRNAYGPALLPQAGVAVGMALVAAEALPYWGSMIMGLTIGATILFEIVGPAVALRAIQEASSAEGSARL